MGVYIDSFVGDDTYWQVKLISRIGCLYEAVQQGWRSGKLVPERLAMEVELVRERGKRCNVFFPVFERPWCIYWLERSGYIEIL
jgi:hypothetical protein